MFIRNILCLVRCAQGYSTESFEGYAFYRFRRLVIFIIISKKQSLSVVPSDYQSIDFKNNLATDSFLQQIIRKVSHHYVAQSASFRYLCVLSSSSQWPQNLEIVLYIHSESKDLVKLENNLLARTVMKDQTERKI